MATINEHDDYTEVIVDAGETWSKWLDEGETWENVLIDITNNYAHYRIHSDGASNWTIRNIGIRGLWDVDEHKVEPFIVYDPSSSGQSRVENIYLPGATPHDRSFDNDQNSITGIWVGSGHSGHLDIERVYVSDYGDNGIRFDGPGSDGTVTGAGGQGIVEVRNCYAAHCTPAGIRGGTDGSSVHNCVMHENYGNYWQFYRDMTMHNCDMNNGVLADIRLGDAVWETPGDIDVTDNNYYQSGHIAQHRSNVTVTGSPAGSARRTEASEVNGVPTTPLEAATDSTDYDDDDDPPDDGDDDDDTGDTAPDPLQQELFDHNNLDAHYDGDTGDFDISGPN